MKKTLIAIGVLAYSMSCFAESVPANTTSESQQATSVSTPAEESITKGIQYGVLPTSPSPDKEVVEFFSFNCPSCRVFENDYHGAQLIAKTLPKDVNFKRYHLNNFGPLAKELSEAWAVANVLGIEDKVEDVFYKAMQTDKKIKTAEDIKTVFADLGVDAQTYDKTKDSFLVKTFLSQQADAINELQPGSIPLVVVNRKFFVNSSGLNKDSNEAFINDYAKVTAFLTTLDPHNVKNEEEKPKE